MTENSKDPTAGLFNKESATNSMLAQPGPEPAPSKPVESVAGQNVQQPTKVAQPTPQQAVAGPAQSQGLINLTIVATDENGNDIPAGALYSVRESFTGVGWNHDDEVRITSQGVKAQLKRNQRLVITMKGDV